MRKTFSILALVALGLASLASRADTAYLYWQVNQDSLAEADKIQFSYARIAVENSDGTAVDGAPVYLTAPGSSSALEVGSADGYNIGTSVASLIGTDARNYFSSDYSFVVELMAYQRYNDSGNFDLVGRSTMNYEQIQNHIAYDGMGLPAIEGALSVASFTRIVPEPTSGLMFLVGGALLALRRKRRS